MSEFTNEVPKSDVSAIEGTDTNKEVTVEQNNEAIPSETAKVSRIKLTTLLLQLSYRMNK